MKCGREVLRSPCTKGGRDSPWGRGRHYGGAGVYTEGGEAVLAGQSAGHWAAGDGFCGGRLSRELEGRRTCQPEELRLYSQGVESHGVF